MNKSYRLIWNETTQTWVAVCEFAKARGKRASGAVILAAASIVSGMTPTAAYAAPPNPPAATALPTGGQVVAGTAALAQSGATLNINQTTQRAAVNWQTFNVGSQATVNFNQPNAASVTLNRVSDPNPSQIFGRINAPGQVFLTNSSGVYFAPGASVNVGGLVASTHSLSNADFMAGKNTFTRNGATGAVVNEGNLTAALGGYIALLAPEVRNNGVIVAQLGTVVLAAGETYDLQFNGNSLTSVRVEPATIKALVENGNAVHAPGGLIILSAQAADRLQGGVINNTGTLEATGFTSNGGVIRLEASDTINHSGSINVDAAANSTGNGGTATLIASLANANSTTNVNGEISARGGDLGGNGGFVETSATHLKIADSARITTAAAMGLSGSWLLDPYDFTIAASGGDITGAALTSALGSGAVTIQTAGGSVSCTGVTGCGTGTVAGNGDIFVNDAVSWSANLLTLNAYRNININATMTATNTASLALYYGQGAVAASNTSNITTSGGVVNLPAGTTNFTTKQGSDGAAKAYTVITSLGAAGDATSGVDTLQGMAAVANMTKNYVLGANIDATSASAWNTNTGFTPIGDTTNTYSGTFDGLGHTITLGAGFINNSTMTVAGLFGEIGGPSVTGAVIRNVGLLGGSITTSLASGSLFGVGALVGVSYGSTVYNSYATSAVNARRNAGGLVGRIYGTSSSGTSSISNSYATGNVTANGNTAGGLVGQITGTVESSYATGTVSGAGYSGGLVGGASGSSSINNSYATGNVSGATFVGGLVGLDYGSVSNSYATGAVPTTGTNIGGLIGGIFSSPVITNSFYDTQTTGKTQGIGNGGADVTGTVMGMVTADMKLQANFTSATAANGNVNPAWDFATAPIWKMSAGNNGDYPVLQWQKFATSVSYTLAALTGTYTYNGNPYLLSDLWSSPTAIFGATYNTWTAGTDYSFSATNYTNAGTYSGITVSILKSGFAVAGTGNTTGSLTINKAPITVTGLTGVNRVYDGGTTATLTGTANLGGVFTADSANVTLTTPTGAFADKNVGTAKPITLSGLGGSAAGNYSITTTPTANITRLASVNYIGTTGGNWFDPANWAGGAVPDQANVAAVVIPAATNVTFDSAVASGFSFGLPADIGKGKPSVTSSTGGSLPSWIKFDSKTNSFIATKVPDGGLPLSVIVTVGGAKTAIVISTAAAK